MESKKENSNFDCKSMKQFNSASKGCSKELKNTTEILLDHNDLLLKILKLNTLKKLKSMQHRTKNKTAWGL